GPVAWPTANGEFPAGGVMRAGVVGLIMFCACALVTVTPAHPSTRSAVIRIRTGPVSFALSFIIISVLLFSHCNVKDCEHLNMGRPATLAKGFPPSATA